jgi:hypothetical protein
MCVVPSFKYSGCLSILFSCYFCSPCFHRSVLGFSLRSTGRVSFSRFKFFDLPVSTPESAVSFPTDYFNDSSTFSLRSSLVSAPCSCCCFLIPACTGRTSIERPNLCQAFGPVSSSAGSITVAVPPLGRSRDSEIRVLSQFRSLIYRCCCPSIRVPDSVTTATVSAFDSYAHPTARFCAKIFPVISFGFSVMCIS